MKKIKIFKFIYNDPYNLTEKDIEDEINDFILGIDVIDIKTNIFMTSETNYEYSRCVYICSIVYNETKEDTI